MARTTIYLDDDYEDIKPILKARGVTSLSDIVRELLVFLVGDGETELTKSQIRELVKQFARMKVAELQKQQKITGATEEETREIQKVREKRLSKIRDAVKAEVDRIGSERFAKYMEDTFGDFSSIQDDIIREVSKASGYPVDLADVIAAFRSVKA